MSAHTNSTGNIAREKETGQEYIERKNKEIEEHLNLEQAKKKKWQRGIRGFDKRELK